MIYVVFTNFMHCSCQIGKYEGYIDDTSIQCVFWDVNASNGLGDWSDDGCHYQATLPDGRVVCRCNHLTSFAVLVVRKCLKELMKYYANHR